MKALYLTVALLLLGVASASGQTQPTSDYAQLKDGFNNKISSHSSGGSRGIDVYCLSGCTGGGATGTVDQGAAGAFPWLFKIDQTGSNNKVQIDQSTPGTTNAVFITNFPSGFSLNAGSNLIGKVDINTPYTTSSSPLTNQQTVTASATTLPSNVGKGVCVKTLLSGTQNVYVGGSSVTTANGYELAPGDSACWALSNSNLLSVIASSTGSSVSFSVLP